MKTEKKIKPYKLVKPSKPKLRNYDAYIHDMEKFSKDNADKIFKDTEFYPIRFLFSFAKTSGVGMRGLKPIKKDRRKICNRIMRKDIHDAEISYSKSISSGEYDN